MTIKKSFARRIERVRVLLEELVEDMEEETQTMQDTYDNRSEKWQESTTWEEYQDSVSELDEATTQVRNASDYLCEFSSD